MMDHSLSSLIQKRRRTLGAGTWLILASLMLSSAVAAAPAITSWSSTGGTPTNKHSDEDVMYLVQSGDALHFSMTVSEPVTYTWDINKVDQNVDSPSFDWTLPDDKGVWEIHVSAKNGNGEAHREWVVSTLDSAEAPTFFDFFSDLQYRDGRTETDPWNRPLPQWQPYDSATVVIDASKGFLRRTVDGINQPISAPMAVSQGTWRFWYRFPEGNTGHWGFDVNYIWDSDLPRQCWYGKCSDAHHHCGVYQRPECTFSIDYDGTGWAEDGRWHQVTIIRESTGWVHMYNDYIYEFYVEDGLTLTPDRISATLERYQGHEVELDGFEVYANQYLFPPPEIEYGDYTWNYTFEDYTYYPETRQGIIVKGRKLRLADIATWLGDPSKLSYDPSTKTAIAHADLVIHDGSEFIMDGETLKFDCHADEEHHFVLRYGTNIQINNSTITTTNDHYFVWNNASSTTHFGRPALRTRQDPIEFQPLGYPVFPLGNAGMIRFRLRDSTVDNTTHIFFDSPMEVSIENSKFTNLRETDIGDYTLTGSGSIDEKLFAKGDKSFWVYMDEINTNRFYLKDVSFSGKDAPINVTFLTNALRDTLNVYDLRLAGQNIVIRKSLAQVHGQSHTWEPYLTSSYDYGYGGTGAGMDSKLGLVNCKFEELLIPTDKAWGIVKYYLDVKVVDGVGNPVDNATVSVTNNVDDGGYPTENLEEIKQLFDPMPASPNQYFYLSSQLIHGRALRSTQTDSTGHTPGPGDEAHTMVLADYVKDKDGRTDFSYTVTATKGGKTASMDALDPDEGWYRTDRTWATRIVICNLDSGSCAVETQDPGPPGPDGNVAGCSCAVIGRLRITWNVLWMVGIALWMVGIALSAAVLRRRSTRRHASALPAKGTWDDKRCRGTDTRTSARRGEQWK